MKSFRSKAIFLSSGFLLALLLHLCMQCENSLSNYGENPDDATLEIDIKGMEKGADNAEAAFLSGDPDKVVEMLSEDSKGYYGEQVRAIPTNVLIALGEALKNRVHTVKSSTYAEFEYTDQGETYSIALNLEEENNWKIIRF